MFFINFIIFALVLSLSNVTHLWEQLSIVGLMLISSVISFNDGQSKVKKKETV